MVAFEVGVKRQADDSLKLTGRRFVAEINEQLLAVGAEVAAPFRQPPDASRLLFDDEKLAGCPRTRNHADWMVEPHLFGVQAFQPSWLRDHRHFFRQSWPGRLSELLPQRAQIGDQICELLDRHGLIQSDRHQRRLAGLLGIDHVGRDTDGLAFDIQ